MRKPHRCHPRQLIAVVSILVLLIVAGIGAWTTWRGGDDLVSIREPGPPPSKFDPVAQPDGSWCARNIVTACVRPDGSIHIPRGDATDTLIAFFAIRKMMPNVESSFLWDYSSYEPDYQTQEVNGLLSADDALKAMLKDTGLTIRTSIEPR